MREVYDSLAGLTGVRWADHHQLERDAEADGERPEGEPQLRQTVSRLRAALGAQAQWPARFAHANLEGAPLDSPAIEDYSEAWSSP